MTKRKLWVGAVLLGMTMIAVSSGLQKGNVSMADEASTNEPMLAHNVYFTLKDDSAEAQQKLVEACHKYLKEHPGVVFFAAGTLAEELNRPVNDQDFQVGLHVIFKNKKLHDQYQEAEKHLQFIEENKENWKQVRVFDTLVN